jgi:alpha-tubulin suppressor-like RCC1 family protein
MARLADGSLLAWGAMYAGGSFRMLGAPAPLPFVIDQPATRIASGNHFACAIVADETLRCWGNDEHGELGDGASSITFPAVSSPALSDVVDVSGGAFHACAVLRGGDVYCWGDNASGQLGTGDTSTRDVPSRVLGLSATHVAAGAAHTCARTTAGAVYCWGDASRGQVGVLRATPPETAPREATGVLSDALEAGGHHACALRSGTISCWGADDRGQLGRGTASDSATAAPVSDTAGFGSVEAFALGGAFGCALGSGRVVCWGDDTVGQLGVGTAGSFRSSLIEPVVDDADAPVRATAIGLGLTHACAVVETGVLCSGSNTWGELGDGTLRGRLVATPVVF